MGENSSVSTTLGMEKTSSPKKPNSTPKLDSLPEFNLIPIQPILPDWNNSTETSILGGIGLTEIMIMLLILIAPPYPI